MHHVLNLPVSVYIETDKKPELNFDTINFSDFVPADIYKLVFRSLEKPKNVFVAGRHPHFLHAKPIIKIVSLYFKGWRPRWRSQPVLL